MYAIVNDLGNLEVHTDSDDLCYNCKNLYKCPLVQALSKEYVFLHYSAVEMGYVFMVIILGYLYIKESLPKIKKKTFLLKAFCLLLTVLFSLLLLNFSILSNAKTNQNNVAFNRIKNIAESVIQGNINALYFVDASLFTRIVSYTNGFILFQKNPILGVGLEQSKYKMQRQFELSPLPLTHENMNCLKASYLTGKVTYNRNLLCDVLSETGFLGFVLLYTFLIKTLKNSNRTIKYLNFIDKEFAIILKEISFLMIIFSFYEIGIISLSYHFFILSLCNENILRVRNFYKSLKRTG